MNRHTPLKIIILGVLLMLCGVTLGTSTHSSLAQDGTPEATPPEYVGSTTCSNCHSDLSRTHAASRHGLALQDVSDSKTAIKADFTGDEKDRTVTFPGESAPRPFKAEDIAFVIGSGRYVERYVYKVDRGKYAIFPAEWNVAKKAWESYVRGQNWPDDPAYDFTKNCAGCHTTGLNVKRARWQDDGVECEACHGPGSQHADIADKAGSAPSDSDLKDIRAAIVVSPDAQICGQCHSQGSEPGQNLPFPTRYIPGSTNLLDSSVFTLVPPDSKDHWWEGDHAKQMNMQFNEWIKTTHSKSLADLQTVQNADPACLTCHSADAALVKSQIDAVKAGDRKGEAPQPLTVQAAKFGVTCTSCHDVHSDSKASTNARSVLPDFNLRQDSYSLCTSCHQNTNLMSVPHHPVQDMFEGKQIVKEVDGIPSPHFTAKDGPRCQTCHMPAVPIENFTSASHSLKPILPGVNLDGVKDTCTACHTDTKPADMLKFITDTQQGTKDRVQAAKAAVKGDTPAWVKTALAFVEGDGSWGIHNQRYTNTLLNSVEQQVGLVEAPRMASAPSSRPMQNPADCGQCHQQEYNTWLNSPHAKASLNDAFRKDYAAQKQPAFCMGCHASGYDTKSGAYVYEGIVCSNCHTTQAQAKHPPAPMSAPTNSETCGQCHNGAHAPSYDEWLVSAHAKAGIDCVDCHTPHNNGLRQVDVNTTCGNCHKDAMTDQVHMGANMTCVDCHMKRETEPNGVHVIKTGHSMSIDPSVCASCHGKTHVLSGKGVSGSPPKDTQITDLQNQVATLQGNAGSNVATGVAGGAAGMIIVATLGFLILRRGRLL